MAINTASNFTIGANQPIDDRYVVSTKSALSSLLAYEGLEVYVTGEKTKYRYEGATWVVVESYNKSTIDTKINNLETSIEEAKSYSDTNLATAKSYTDTKVASLIDSAPETLNTLGELAKALEENASVVDALNSAIGNKANTADLGALAFKNSLTKGDVGLGNVLNVASYSKTETDALLKNKVDTSELNKYLPVSGGTITGNLELPDGVSIVNETQKTNIIGSIGANNYIGNINSSLTISGSSITLTGKNGISIDYLKTLKAPTSSGGSTYGFGSSGQVLTTNGSTVYWATPTKTSVVNALTSTSTTSALSAYQGKVLNDKIPKLYEYTFNINITDELGYYIFKIITNSSSSFTVGNESNATTIKNQVANWLYTNGYTSYMASYPANGFIDYDGGNHIYGISATNSTTLIIRYNVDSCDYSTYTEKTPSYVQVTRRQIC